MSKKCNWGGREIIPPTSSKSEAMVVSPFCGNKCIEEYRGRAEEDRSNILSEQNAFL